MKKILLILTILILILVGLVIYYKNRKECVCDVYGERWQQDDLEEWYYDITWIEEEKCKCNGLNYLLE